MKLRPVTASVLLAATLAVAAYANATAPSQSPAPAPAVIAQLEIRGIAPLFDQIARVIAPFAPPQQVESIVRDTLREISPIDLLALAGRDSSEPIRAVIYSKPGADAPGGMLDIPAANGDIDAFFDVVSRSCATAAIPAAVAAHLPAGARLYRLPSTLVSPNGDPRVLFLPHGSRVAVWPLAFRGGVQPVQAARLVAAFPPIDVEGVLALRADLAAIADLRAAQAGLFADFASAAGEFRNGFTTDCAVGIGLDDADRLRFDTSDSLRPDSAIARYFATLSSPAPFVNAALFPDAIAAAVQHADPSLVNQAYTDELLAAAAASPQSREIEPLLRHFAGLAPQFAALSSSDSALALYPSTPDRALPWVSCTALPDGIFSLDDFETRANDIARALLDLAAMALSAAGNDCDIDDFAVRLVPVADRSLADTDIPVRSYALTVAVPDADPDDPDADSDDPDGGPVTLLTFDAAIAGPALVLGSLPEDRLAAILSTLSTGATPSTTIADLPAFANAYGPLPDGSAAAVVQLLPLLRGVLAKLGQYDVNLPANVPEALAIFPDTLTLPLALVIRPGASPSTFRETFSIPLSDLHSFIQSIANHP